MLFFPFTKNYYDYNKLLELSKKKENHIEINKILNQSSYQVYNEFIKHLIKTNNTDLLSSEDFDLRRGKLDFCRNISSSFHWELGCDYSDVIDNHIDILNSVKRVHSDLDISDLLIDFGYVFYLEDANYEDFKNRKDQLKDKITELLDLGIKYNERYIKSKILNIPYEYEDKINLYNFNLIIEIFKILKINI